MCSGFDDTFKAMDRRKMKEQARESNVGQTALGPALARWVAAQRKNTSYQGGVIILPTRRKSSSGVR